MWPLLRLSCVSAVLLAGSFMAHLLFLDGMFHKKLVCRARGVCLLSFNRKSTPAVAVAVAVAWSDALQQC
jgi:hypothetical protein